MKKDNEKKEMNSELKLAIGESIRKDKDKNMITIKEDVRIPGTNIILEAGDKIEIQQLEEVMEDIDVDQIDTAPLLNYAKSLNFPVKDIEIMENRNRLTADFAPSFWGKDLGVFSAGVKTATLSTFNSDIKDSVWWATWILSYELVEGGRNGVEVFTSWYNFETKRWEFESKK